MIPQALCWGLICAHTCSCYVWQHVISTSFGEIMHGPKYFALPNTKQDANVASAASAWLEMKDSEE
jgi:hypothetical protein